MITPFFTIRQDDNFLYIHIKAPCAKLKSTVIEFGGFSDTESQFLFSSLPYFLKLYLPGKVTENGEEDVKWLAEDGAFDVKVPKLNKGEHFEGLDMVTKLLTNPNKSDTRSPFVGIEMVSQSSVGSSTLSEDDEFDWSVDQKPVTEAEETSLLNGEKYGFASRYTGVISRLLDTFVDVIEVKDPEKWSASERRSQRWQKEQADFSDDHYLADLYEESETIEKLIRLPMFWETIEAASPFDEDELFRLKNLPKRSYVVDKSTRKAVFLGLVDILFAYAYDARTTEGEHNAESGWTIAKLSASLSWFETFSSMEQVATSSVRRSLCYPLYRHWNLALKTLEDTRRIIEQGPKVVLRCLLKVHALLNKESRYILNDLYVTDYCVWIQTCKNSAFLKLAKLLQSVIVTKSSVDLDLPILETAAQLALEEQTEPLQCKLSSLSVADAGKGDCAISRSFASLDGNSHNDGCQIDSDDFSSSEESSSGSEGISSDEEAIDFDKHIREEKSR